VATSVARTTSSQSTQRTAPWGIQIWVVANSPGVCAYHHANLEDPMHSTITLSCVPESRFTLQPLGLSHAVRWTAETTIRQPGQMPRAWRALRHLGLEWPRCRAPVSTPPPLPTLRPWSSRTGATTAECVVYTDGS